MTFEQLVTEAKNGSSAAEKCLFDMLADQLFLLCSRYVKKREDAEEVMLDGFYKFFKNINAFQYRDDAGLVAWVRKIMINECLMFLRKNKSLSIVTEADAAALPLQEEALDNLSAVEIFSMIVQLPVGYRTVFNLSAMEGMAHKEIAVLLGITEGTSKSQLSKARSLLQKMLLQKGGNYALQRSK